jgi:hypothetical protein
MAVSSQQEPYIKENLEPLTEQERMVARTIFTSGTPCLKCHITGDAAHDKTAIAPNFLLAGERLKPDWTFRWLLDPSQISPGTAMPTGLFKKAGESWVVNLEQPPPTISDYHKDHAQLLVRYMFLMTPDEQRRLMSTAPTATAGQPPAPKETESNPATSGPGQKVGRNNGTKKGANTSARLRMEGPRSRAPDVRPALAHRAASYSP